MEDKLWPFVYWGQNTGSISLRVELQNVTINTVDLTEERIEMTLNGTGAMGHNFYGFDIDFYLPVDEEESKLRVTDRGVEISIKKQGEEVWPRLTEKQVRLPWLKIDFDKFPVDEDIDEDDSVEQHAAEEMAKQIEKELKLENTGKPLGMKNYYVFFYNLLQFIGFFYIIATLSYQYLRYGVEIKQRTFELVGSQIMFCQIVAVLEIIHPMVGLVKTGVMSPFMQIVAVLEIIHPMVGLVKTGVMSPFMQVCGRNFILFMLILQDFRLQVAPAVWYLFMTWGSVELIRYPFYMFSSLGMDVNVVTWLRYSAWIPLYPLGILFESSIVIMAIPMFEESNRFSIQLPNAANIAFYFPWFLYAYLLVLAIAGCKMINHMYYQRKKKMYPDMSAKKRQ